MITTQLVVQGLEQLVFWWKDNVIVGQKKKHEWKKAI